jgi:hypothetical protein
MPLIVAKAEVADRTRPASVAGGPGPEELSITWRTHVLLFIGPALS